MTIVEAPIHDCKSASELARHSLPNRGTLLHDMQACAVCPGNRESLILHLSQMLARLRGVAARNRDENSPGEIEPYFVSEFFPDAPDPRDIVNAVECAMAGHQCISIPKNKS